jgi:sialic acid synthase SpsE
MMGHEREVYLGDGLYASFDGYHFILRAPREGGDHYVALEPAVFAVLLKFRKETYAEYGVQVPL